MQALRKLALRYPEVEEGVACQGTALECATFKARGKAFLFVGAGAIRLKLDQSLPEASRLAAKVPARYKVGAKGWISVTQGDGAGLDLKLLEKWIDESYRLLAPKQLLAQIPSAKGAPRQAATKAAPKRRTAKTAK